MENMASQKAENFADSLATISGIVKRLVFKNQENDFAILSVESDQIPSFAIDTRYPKSFVSLGCFPRVSVGQKIKIFGKWKFNSKYGGWQLASEKWEEEAPTTESTMVEYLSSGIFKGIGKKTAENIVEKFGIDSLRIIKTEPERLNEVSGISAGKVSAIIDSYKKSAHLEKLMMSLKPYRIPTAKIVKIHQAYGDEAMNKIKDNPYRLCDDIRGIGFRVADMIARSFEKSPNDDFRIRAGIIHVLNEVANAEGHTYLPFDNMIERTKKLLKASEVGGNVEANDIVRVAVDMNNAKDIVCEKDHACYLSIFYAGELNIARKIQLLCSKKPKPLKYNIDETIAQLERKYQIKYAEQQKKSFRTLAENNIMVITGGPGTGKTTIIKGIIDIYKRNFHGCKISLCAPTGRAAKRMEEATGMEAKTIHRMIEYRPDSNGDLACGRNEKNPIEADVIIVDEASMIDLLLFASFLRAVAPNTVVIIVGDADQLPSVKAGNVLRDLIACNKLPVVCLNEIFRQEEASKIIINSAKINRGETDLEFNEEFEFIEENNPEKIPELVLQHCRMELERLKWNLNDVQVLTPFRRETVNGVEQLNVGLQNNINPKYTSKPEIHYRQTIFRKYDKVLQCKNNYDKEIYNGDTGIIEIVNQDTATMMVRMDGELVEFAKEELDELQLAYATTIHKSQGCEYDTVILPVTMQHKIMLQRNLLYTGVTRAKKKVKIIGERKALEYAIQRNRISTRFSKLSERIL